MRSPIIRVLGLIPILAGIAWLTLVSGEATAQETASASGVKEGIVTLADSKIQYFSRGAERGITMEQLFAVARGLPAAIDEAREDLDGKVRADRQAEAAAYQIFDVVPGQDADDEG